MRVNSVRALRSEDALDSLRRALVDAPTLDELLHQTAAALLRRFELDSCHIVDPTNAAGRPQGVVKRPTGAPTGQRASARFPIDGLLHRFGYISVCRTKALSQEERTLLQEAAGIVALAIERLQTAEREQRRRRAGRSTLDANVHDIDALKNAEAKLGSVTARLLQVQDEERRRIARALHDQTAQNLAAVSINLQLIHDANVLALPSRARLAESRELVDCCLREIRTLSYLLHPPLLDELGLLAAIRWYADGFATRSGIAVSLRVPQYLGRVSPEIETALFRIVQESLTNIHRHSGSPSVAIALERAAGELRLEVRDRGRGMPELSRYGLAPVGVGIAGMSERVRQLGGRFEVISRDTGTVVRAALPVESGGIHEQGPPPHRG
jgi:signal transduction histidine kinase